MNPIYFKIKLDKDLLNCLYNLPSIYKNNKKIFIKNTEDYYYNELFSNYLIYLYKMLHGLLYLAELIKYYFHFKNI